MHPRNRETGSSMEIQDKGLDTWEIIGTEGLQRSGGGTGGAEDCWSGRREKRHKQGLVCSRQPVRMASPLVL